MFGIATAFNYETPGNAPLQASYTQGRDLTVPGGASVPGYGIYLARSMANPISTLDPDHYSLRNIGGDPHYNATIATHAFYLAIEGGTNRVSKLAVQGVGAANREQIEKSFFRALTVLMPSSSTYALTRVATIQAATDLYGGGSAAVRAITQAWDAVGVQPRTVPTATILPNPIVGTTATSCGGVVPTWVFGVTVSAGTSGLRITQAEFDQYSSAGALIEKDLFSPALYASFFNQCGPGSATIVAQSDSCSAICTTMDPGVTSGSVQALFTALDDAGKTVTFSTPRVALTPPQ